MTRPTAPTPQRVLVLGATGYIGRAVVEHLSLRGHRVLALLRPGSRAGGLPAGVEVRRGDLADVFVLAAERAEPGSVLHGVTERAVDTGALALAAATAAGVRGVRPWPLVDARRGLGEAFADALACDQSVSADATRRALGWEPTGPTALADVAAGSYAVADVA